MSSQNTNRMLFSLLFFSFLTLQAGAQSKLGSREKAIITAMKNSENDWNKGDLKSFMKMYISASTMMMPTGPAGLSAIWDLYQSHYFIGKMPKQHLFYDEMKVTPLGENYALLTGKFTLSGNKLPERSGRYSLVMIHTKDGWKILHDHSS
ncbi:MAG TPA: nuclear transport factor 2 family protein [Puia sp.]|jgi:ketosteroid isomerase-like protein|nr:nuclear transport factor 2 family protein [Puia sp.]